MFKTKTKQTPKMAIGTSLPLFYLGVSHNSHYIEYIFCMSTKCQKQHLILSCLSFMQNGQKWLLLAEQKMRLTKGFNQFLKTRFFFDQKRRLVIDNRFRINKQSTVAICRIKCVLNYWITWSDYWSIIPNQYTNVHYNADQ